MDDPHVVKLHYQIKHDQTVHYKNATTMTCETPLFIAHVEADRVELEMKAHFASAGEAKAAVAPLLRAWEVWAGLARVPDGFELTFDRCELIDRRPTPGAIELTVGIARGVGMSPSIVIGQAAYPEMPDYFVVDSDMELMYGRYRQYRKGNEPLGPFANFIYTTTKGGSRGQQTSEAKRLGIDNCVLMKLNTLCAEKGGRSGARKYEGAASEFTPAERHWLEEVVKAIMRRTGRVAADPARNKPLIQLHDLPPL
jgi:hypothetical protein